VVVRTQIFGESRGTVEILSTHISSVENVQLSVGKLELPVVPIFFNPRRFRCWIVLLGVLCYVSRCRAAKESFRHSRNESVIYHRAGVQSEI